MTVELPQAIERLSDRSGDRAAAFDADGVLWYGDVSEDFTRWMIARGRFDEGLWAGYEAANAADKAGGAIDILRFYAGHDRAALRADVAEFWRTGPQRDWIAVALAALRRLADAGFEIYVVSASPHVVLEPLVEHLPVPAANILALELEFDAAGRATGRHTNTPTCGPGKAARLRSATSSPVLLAVGNSVLDIDMLECSEAVRWVLDPDEPLREHASRAGWLIWETRNV